MVLNYLKVFALGILFALVSALLIGVFVMLIWNALIPELFGFSSIGYLQACGLTLLFRMLFASASLKSKT